MPIFGDLNTPAIRVCRELIADNALAFARGVVGGPRDKRPVGPEAAVGDEQVQVGVAANSWSAVLRRTNGVGHWFVLRCVRVARAATGYQSPVVGRGRAWQTRIFLSTVVYWGAGDLPAAVVPQSSPDLVLAVIFLWWAITEPKRA